MSVCGCRPGTHVREWCPVGQDLARRDAEATTIRIRLIKLGVEDPDYIAAKQRLQRSHDTLMAHLAGEAQQELDANAMAERGALKAGA